MSESASQSVVTPPLESEQATLSPGHSLLVFLVLLLLWLLLAGTLHWQELVAGLLAAGITTLLSRPHLYLFNAIRLEPGALIALLHYLRYFFVQLVHANLDLASRVLRPSLPIAPHLVEVETALESPLGRMLLANSITLTPGTLTVEMNDKVLLIHWVYCPEALDREQASAAIAAGFERHIKGFLR